MKSEVIKKPFKPSKLSAQHQTTSQNTVYNFHGAVAIEVFTNRGLRFDILLVQFKLHRSTTLRACLVCINLYRNFDFLGIDKR